MTETKKDFTAYATKAPTDLHTFYVGWLEEKTGVTDIDPKTVQLAVSLYGDFQRSDEWKAERAKLDEQRAAEKAKIQASRQERKVKVVTAKVDQLAKGLQAAIDMMKAGAELPDDIQAAVEALAAERGIELPKQQDTDENPEVEPETSLEEQILNSEFKSEATKPEPTEAQARAARRVAKAQRPSKAAKAAVGRAISAEAAKVDA